MHGLIPHSPLRSMPRGRGRKRASSSERALPSKRPKSAGGNDDHSGDSGAASGDGWACATCTFVNRAQFLCCEVCGAALVGGTPLADKQLPSATPTARPAGGDDVWRCLECRAPNIRSENDRACRACGHVRAVALPGVIIGTMEVLGVRVGAWVRGEIGGGIVDVFCCRRCAFCLISLRLTYVFVGVLLSAIDCCCRCCLPHLPCLCVGTINRRRSAARHSHVLPSPISRRPIPPSGSSARAGEAVVMDPSQFWQCRKCLAVNARTGSAICPSCFSPTG